MKRTEWVAGVVVALAVGLAASVPLQVATAAPPDSPWVSASSTTIGPTVETRVINDGSTGSAIVAYDNFAPEVGGGGANGSVEVTAFSGGPQTVDLSWSLAGFHAFFQATVGLDAIVIGDGGTTVIPLITAGPADCPPC